MKFNSGFKGLKAILDLIIQKNTEDWWRGRGRKQWHAVLKPTPNNYQQKTKNSVRTTRR